MTQNSHTPSPRRIMPERLYQGQSFNCIYGLIMDKTDLRTLALGERHLAGPFILPPFQRPLVWTNRQKVRLIESIYLGLPIGSIIWNRTRANEPTDSWLLDGQQRLSAIYGYLNNEFPVCGYIWRNLPESEKVHFKRICIGMIEVNICDPEQCRDLYERLVYGGTPHDPK